MRIAFVGAGNMGEAILRAILDKKVAKADDVVASDVSKERRSYLSRQYGVTVESDNRRAVENAESVVLAVKPTTLPKVTAELKGLLQPEQTVISIVAGASAASISKALSHQAVIRAMPNMPAQIGEGVTVWTAASGIKEKHRKRARSILSAMGIEVFMSDEKHIDMATAVSGSGPGYVFLIIESLIDASVHIGLPREVAQELVLETISGATHLIQKSGKHPAELRNMVASPGGTTVEGLLQLEEGGLRALLAQAVIAGYEKAKALRQQ